jgi:outer membrane protein
MEIKQLVCIAALVSPFMANADTLSISAGGGVWNESPSGNFQTTTDLVDVDVEDSLFWDKESQGYFFITIEHFIPIIPNVRLMHTKIDHSGSGDTDLGFDFDGQTFSGIVSNDFSIETTDLIAYYEVLDNVVSLDLGLNIRHLEIDYTITSESAGSTASDSISETIPMLYAMVGASPWPDLIISAELSYIGYSGSGFSDFTAKIAYTTEFFVGLEAGYRKQSFELDDIADTNANLDFDGIFAGAYLKF